VKLKKTEGKIENSEKIESDEMSENVADITKNIEFIKENEFIDSIISLSDKINLNEESQEI